MIILYILADRWRIQDFKRGGGGGDIILDTITIGVKIYR